MSGWAIFINGVPGSGKSILGLISRPAIVESFWFRGRDDRFFAAGLAAAGISDGVELWCEAAPATGRARFTSRLRHHAHSDASRLAEWEVFSRDAEPLSGFPIIRVPTDGPVDARALATALKPRLGVFA